LGSALVPLRIGWGNLPIQVVEFAQDLPCLSVQPAQVLMLEGDEQGRVDEECPASREGVYCTSEASCGSDPGHQFHLTAHFLYQDIAVK
jgi:hypothetical protein